MRKVLTLGWSTSNHLQRWALSLAERGYRLLVVSYAGAGEIAGVETVNLPRRVGGKLGYLLSLPALYRICAEFRPDVIHAHFITSYGLWGARLAQRSGAPLVLTGWGSDITQSVGSPLYRRLLRGALQTAAAVTVPSQYLQEQLARVDGSVTEKSHVIPFGVDRARLELAFAGKKRAEDRDGGRLRFLMFKPLEPLYGHELALRAFAEVAREFPSLELSIAGQGSIAGPLRELISQLELDERVRIVGFVPYERAYEFIAEHEVMLMPTLIPEGFGMAALEASALELPVIAAGHGAVSEIVVDGETGLLVAPGSAPELTAALRAVAADPELRSRLGSAARRRALERFDWDQSVAAMERLYRGVLSAQR